MVHMPWLDFEENINQFRMEGAMFLERKWPFQLGGPGVDGGAASGREIGPRPTSGR